MVLPSVKLQNGFTLWEDATGAFHQKCQTSTLVPLIVWNTVSLWEPPFCQTCCQHVLINSLEDHKHSVRGLQTANTAATFHQPCQRNKSERKNPLYANGGFASGPCFSSLVFPFFLKNLIIFFKGTERERALDEPSVGLLVRRAYFFLISKERSMKSKAELDVTIGKTFRNLFLLNFFFFFETYMYIFF